MKIVVHLLRIGVEAWEVFVHSECHRTMLDFKHSNGTTLLSPLLVHIWVYDAEILFLLLALPLAKC